MFVGTNHGGENIRQLGVKRRVFSDRGLQAPGNMYTRCIAVVGTRQVRALDCRLNSKKLDEPGLEIGAAAGDRKDLFLNHFIGLPTAIAPAKNLSFSVPPTLNG